MFWPFLNLGDSNFYPKKCTNFEELGPDQMKSIFKILVAIFWGICPKNMFERSKIRPYHNLSAHLGGIHFQG